MSSGIALPSFILGYHGCDTELVDRVLTGQQILEPSQNDYDWLGDGVYFWEHNAHRAYEFAQAMCSRPHPSGQKIRKPGVVGAVIDLGYCLNLLESQSIQMVRDAHGLLKETIEKVDLKMPQNTLGPDRVDRKLDCAVIRALHEYRKEKRLKFFETVRAVFIEGEPLYPEAGFAARNHIQVAVRDHRCIKGYFRPLNEHGEPLFA